MDAGRILIVVQIYRRLFLSFGRMFVDGFVIESDGRIAEPEPRLLYGYT